jgi:hypothetical protein
MADRLRLRAGPPPATLIRHDDNFTSSTVDSNFFSSQIRTSVGSSEQSKRDKKIAMYYVVSFAATLLIVGALLYLHSKATAAALIKATVASEVLLSSSSSSFLAGAKKSSPLAEKNVLANTIELHRPRSRPHLKSEIVEDIARGMSPNTRMREKNDLVEGVGLRSRSPGRRILTIYSQSINATVAPPNAKRLVKLEKLEYGWLANDCSGLAPILPVDPGDFPESDPYLPWIHDYFVAADAQSVQFVAQNKRRCQTGQGMEATMRYWEPQVALMQPVPVLETTVVVSESGIDHANLESRYALTTTPENATYPETRFLCSFQDEHGNASTSLSTYRFNYEYIAWRKVKSMFFHRGRDVENYEFSTLLFRCPIPERFQHLVAAQPQPPNQRIEPPPPRLWLDVVPIRTKVRSPEEGFLLTKNHVGPTEYPALRRFDASRAYGNSTIVMPPIKESGRWSNLAICPPLRGTVRSTAGMTREVGGSTRTVVQPKDHHLVLCTWTSAYYKRRGDVVSVDDAAQRLSEWIEFHRLVGVDHIYLYDNTPTPSPPPPPLRDGSHLDDRGGGARHETPLRRVAERYEGFVTHISWPYQVCSNNRPNYKNPGERSSQYAAEASCRERFGSTTEWMSFLDTDEYLVPLLNGATNWTDLLRIKEEQGYQILKLRSARGKPRIDLMEPLANVSVRETTLCGTRNTASTAANKRSRSLPEDPCVVPRQNETFLKVYNCNYIRPPLPDRFARAMKQIYRPSFVYGHFVHYTTVTAPMATYYKNWLPDPANYTRKVRNEPNELWYVTNAVVHRWSHSVFLTAGFRAQEGHFPRRSYGGHLDSHQVGPAPRDDDPNGSLPARIQAHVQRRIRMPRHHTLCRRRPSEKRVPRHVRRLLQLLGSGAP